LKKSADAAIPVLFPKKRVALGCQPEADCQSAWRWTMETLPVFPPARPLPGSARCNEPCAQTPYRCEPADHKTTRRTAPHGAVVSQGFRITHPFHPQVGQEFEVVERRSIRDQDLIFYQDARGCLRSISTSFTSLGVSDAVVVLGAGRSRFRVADLL